MEDYILFFLILSFTFIFTFFLIIILNFFIKKYDKVKVTYLNSYSEIKRIYILKNNCNITNHSLQQYNVYFNKFNIIKLRNGFLKIIKAIDKSDKKEHNILQRMYKPRDFFELYFYFIINNLNFEVIIYFPLKNYKSKDYEINNVLRSGPNVMFDKKNRKRMLQWDMICEGKSKILHLCTFKTPN